MKSVHQHIQSIFSELSQTLAQLSNSEIQSLMKRIVDAEKVFIAGAGRAGFAGKAFAMRLMHLGIETFIVGETTTPRCTANDFLLIVSASGKTETLVAMANKVKKIDTPIGLITTRPTSEIANLAEHVLILPAPSPKVENEHDLVSCQPMGSLFVQSLWITLDALILCLMEELNQDTNMMFTRHTNLE